MFNQVDISSFGSFTDLTWKKSLKVANYVLDKIYVADPHQYNALLKSIGEPPRTT